MNNLVVPDDRAGNQLWKEGYVKRVVGKAIVGRLSTIEVDQIGDLLKGEKADAQGQNDVPGIVRPTERSRYGADQEIGVLEKSDEYQVEPNADEHQASKATPLISLGEKPVNRDRANQQRQEAKVPIAVEAQGCDDQDPDAHPVVFGQQIIDAEGERQKCE